MLPTDTTRDIDTLHSGEDVLVSLLGQPDSWALFLDIDGTLLDLAATPDAIIVPPELADHLARLANRLDGALALVTGRALVYADTLFSPLVLPIAGLHGAERRRADGSVDSVAQDPAFSTLKASLARVTGDWNGVLIEDKGAAVAAHYRQAPQWQQSVEAVMHSALEEAGPDYALQRGKMVIEIRPARASKGAAVRAFLSEPPFVGRKPIAIGDDVTDEAMFKVANDMGGCSIRIGEPTAETAARYTIASADALRQMLKGLASE
ncbi:trehalose-phosphatase [Rhizobium sp. SSA_523]|uniref:trehalose-phosphatase n=1 Tax=Rhizobium sp. SSA_523 TaxID=2952477 RepID=UPI0020905C15|nr:trehalose-phosphatase [Rhizobium sp. SSA_523]MCO5732686.1 trehalose-phosphatase [Rhizobium sp. SSA_523]WKC23686.1 trehalose-phosphatase [Rhizobium sp. SSA_523]